jgi:hypothetical protein
LIDRFSSGSCCVGAVTAGFLAFRGISDAVKPAQDAASAYADDIRDGDYPGAYGRLCERVRSRVSQEVFADSMAQDFGANVNNRNGVTTATVTMRITRPTGTSFNHTFPLVQESGTWKVCE